MTLRNSSLLAILPPLLLAWGCSSDPSEMDPKTTTDAAPSEPDADTRAGDTFMATWGPLDVEPGVENTKCMVAQLGNDREVRIGSITNDLGDASHHFIVYRIAEGEVSTEPYDCDPFSDVLNPSAGAPLMVTQKAQETLQLPEGVGFSFVPNQLVRLELHYVNYGNTTQSVTATSTFKTISDADFKDEADFLFIGNPDINLPPGQSSTLGPSYLPLPAELEGSNIFGITGHTHQWGTDVQVELKEGEDGPSTMLYDVENFLWDEPETTMLSPEVTIAAGSGFNFSCEWNNQSDTNVGFGEGVNEEMCFFWAYYYPSKGAKVCVHTDQYPEVATDICCPGDALCALIDNIL